MSSRLSLHTAIAAGGIPGGETIVFEIELIKVLKPGELAEAARKIHEKEQNEGIKKPH